jgi:hypothetical protein
MSILGEGLKAKSREAKSREAKSAEQCPGSGKHKFKLL